MHNNTLFEIHQPLLILAYVSVSIFMLQCYFWKTKSAVGTSTYHLLLLLPYCCLNSLGRDLRNCYYYAASVYYYHNTCIYYHYKKTSLHYYYCIYSAFWEQKVKRILKKPLSTLCTIGNSAIILVCDRSMLTIFPRTSPLLLRSATWRTQT